MKPVLQRGPEVCFRVEGELRLFPPTSPSFLLPSLTGLHSATSLCKFDKGQRSHPVSQREKDGYHTGKGIGSRWGGIKGYGRRRWRQEGQINKKEGGCSIENSKKCKWCTICGYQGLMKRRETKQWRRCKSLLASITFRLWNGSQVKCTWKVTYKLCWAAACQKDETPITRTQRFTASARSIAYQCVAKCHLFFCVCVWMCLCTVPAVCDFRK